MTTGLVSSSEDNNMVVMRIKDIEGLVSSSPRLTDDFLKKIFVKMWTIFFFKSLLNLSRHYFCIYVLFFGGEACEILAPRPGIEPTTPA